MLTSFIPSIVQSLPSNVLLIFLASLICASLLSSFAASSSSFDQSQVKNMSKTLFRKVLQSKLGVSEPNPAWFGNPQNEARNPTWTNKNWLKSRFHFSFAEYSNPHNTNFGVLRVMNDDLVQPNRGFGEHPHRDTEICTYVVHGQLSHQDSMGTEETLGRGAIQFMSAGRGVQHSEHNHHQSEVLRFVQIWINTRSRGLKPNYGSYVGNEAGRLNQWQHLVGDVGQSTSTSAVQINQDANIFVTEIEAGKQVEFTVQDGRQAYLLCVEGSGLIQGQHGTDETLDRHDAAELYGPLTFTITPTETPATSTETPAVTTSAAHFLLVEMQYAGLGRSDL